MEKKDRGRFGKKKYIRDDLRNIIPNIVHQIYSFLLNSNRSEQFLRRILETETEPAIESTIRDYYHFMKCFRAKMDKNLSKGSLKALLKAEKYEEWRSDGIKFKKFTVLLIRHFLHSSESLVNILSSRKIPSWKFPKYMGGIRMIQELVEKELRRADHHNI